MKWMSLLVLGGMLVGGAQGADEAARRPNVVLFVADDHGREALGCYGNKVIKTPNMDRLAAEGTLYRNAFCTTASCSASRSVILSGLQNHANGHYGHQHAYHHFAAFSSVRSLPVILSENGYRTARIGKYHVAPEEVYHFEQTLPTAQGSRNPVKMAENCRPFVSEKSKPFFLYFCVTDPHRSGKVVETIAERPNAFGNEQEHPGVTEVKYDPKDVIVPSWMPETPAARAEIAQYYQAISRIDQGLGRLVEILKETGQYDNTVIIYTSDNGSAMPGSKTTLYEPGMRLPLIVRDPAARKHGVVTDAMISWVDFTPTILDWAGIRKVMAPPLMQGEPGEDNPRSARKPQKLVEYTFHGRSFRETIEGENAQNWKEVYGSHTFHEITMYYPMRVIRTERYKLTLNLAHPLAFPFASDIQESATWQSALKSGTGGMYGKRTIDAFLHRPQYELYDLQKDPDEIVNLADKLEYREIFEQLSAKLKEYQKKTRDPWVVKYDYE